MGVFTETTGDTSSRRVAAFVFPAILYIGGIVGLIIGIAGNAAQWPIIGGISMLVLGVVLQLWLFNLINATNIQEIIKNATGKD